MSILKNMRDNNSEPADNSTTTSSIEELNKLLDSVDAIIKKTRSAVRQSKRLDDRISDLIDAGIKNRAVQHAQEDLEDMEIDALSARLNTLRTDLDLAIDAPNNVSGAKITSFRRHLSNLQIESDEITATLEDVEDVVKDAEAKADKATNASAQPQAKVNDASDAVTIGDGEEIGAKMLAMQMLADYRNAGCPALKDKDGHPIVFALPVERPSGIKYIRMDVHAADSEDLPDLVPGVMEKKNFVPLTSKTGQVAKELILLSNAPNLW